MAASIRIGAVSYLNAKPLYYPAQRALPPRLSSAWTCPADWPIDWREATSMSP